MTGVQTCALPICFPVTIKVLKSLKKLKDESGKALLNGELTDINKKVTEFKDEFETFIIEK